MSNPTLFLGGKVVLHRGDCRDVVGSLPDGSVDSVVTDPPYSLVSIVKRFGKEGSAPAKSHGASGVYKRASAGFMGKQWDTGEVAFDPAFWTDVLRVLKPGGHLAAFSGTRTYHRMACAIEDGGFEVRDQLAWAYGSGFPKSHNAGNGRGTALKPAWEPICLARKSLIGTVAANVAAHGTGALNIDACRVATDDHINQPSTLGTQCGSSDGWSRPWQADKDAVAARDARARASIARAERLGRWPANLVHDGSEEVLAAFPHTASGTGAVKKATAAGHQNSAYGKESRPAGTPNIEYGDAGSAARFFYTAKADADDRIGSKHPTVKPVNLMRWLCRLITPPGGTILDPFAGTGTTGEAAFYEGFNAILVEREDEYQADIERRMKLCLSGPDERKRESIKAKLADKPVDAGPLFGDAA